jgi:hypothetical protein
VFFLLIIKSYLRGSQKYIRSILYLGGEKTVFLYEFRCLSLWLFLSFLFFKKFSQAFLSAKIVISPFHSLPNGCLPKDIGLAIGVLNKFLWLRLSPPFVPPHHHIFNKVVKNRIEEEKKEDK